MINNMILNGDKIRVKMEEELFDFQCYLIGREFNTMLAELLKSEENYRELVEKLEES